MSSHTRLWTVVVLVLSSPAGAGAQTAPAPNLASLFEPGVILQDRNGDDVVDFVDARIVLGEAPSDAEVATAADVAARLGFETTALDLFSASGAVPIAVGAAGVARARIPVEAAGLASLEAGDGVVRTIAVNGGVAVVVAGGDDAGLRAAGAMLAGRVPFVWEPGGPTLTKVAEDVAAFLGDRGVEVAAARVPALRVRHGADGLESLLVEVTLATGTALARAADALRTLSAGRSGGVLGPEPRPDGVGDGEPRLSYTRARRLRVVLEAEGVDAVTVDVPSASQPVAGPLGRRPGSGAKDRLDLSSLFHVEGWLGDANDDLIPDRVDALLSPSGEGTQGTVELAARIGLESTGVSIPIASPPEALGDPDAEPTLVLIGREHPLVEDLVEAGTLELPDLEAGEGVVTVVRRAFGDKRAVVIAGGDAVGLERAIRQVAERFPHIWARGKGRTTIDDVEQDVWAFLSGRSPAGQAAAALYKLDQLTSELSGVDLQWARVTLHLEKPDAGLAEMVRRHAAARLVASEVDVVVEARDVDHAKPIDVGGAPISVEFEVPSEVDEFWRVFDARVLPEVERSGRGEAVAIEARLSEPPEIRARIARDARARLIAAGGVEGGTSVTVLSAYKQGYSWLYDVVRPRLIGQGVERVRIRFAEIGPPPSWTQQAMYAPTRWLLELFPIDEVLSRELSLDLERFTFEKMPIGSPAYEVIAEGPDGRELLRETFEPTYVVRPYFDRFPSYEQVRVTTGWLQASVGGRVVVDQRIVTDPERFWDRFQSQTLPAIYDYVMDLHEGKPLASDAPHFGQLVVELSLSEPDYRVGVDLEQISSLEAVHEEIYFGTLHFFDVLGRYARGEPLDYPGRVIPIVRPRADGRPGRAKISFTGFGSRRPAVVLEFREHGGREGRLDLDIPRVDLGRPEALSAWVRDGVEGLHRLDLRVTVQTETDERAALVRRAREEEVDRRILSAAQVTALWDSLSRLRAAGLYRDALAYHDLGELRIAAAWTHDDESVTRRVASLPPNGEAQPFPNISRYLPAEPPAEGEPIVQWETPIPPDEAYSRLALMSEFEAASVYRLGESYLGRDIWAMDLMSPVEATHWSQAKVSTTKPTVVYSARQHANEVSSTSHVLKFAERLLTDDELRPALRKVNVVIHPITNPDGAQLAYDLHQITPDHMLHAGYLGSLGVDVTAAQWEDDPVYPESAVRRRLWRTWLPDIFLNPHGYPSHEWVQLFSEYAGWVRNRVTRSRDWWGMRGWFMPGFSYLDDPKYPRHKDAAFRIRELITSHINADPEVQALNRRAYARYQRYGFDHDPENFKLDFTDDVLIYTAIRGAAADARGRDFMVRHPKITIWTGTTEAPDETAYGDWLQLVASAGLQWDIAILRYLLEGDHTVERDGESFYGGVTLTMSRPRPPKPEDEDERP